MSRVGQFASRRKVSKTRDGAIVKACDAALENLEDRRLLSVATDIGSARHVAHVHHVAHMRHMTVLAKAGGVDSTISTAVASPLPVGAPGSTVIQPDGTGANIAFEAEDAYTFGRTGATWKVVTSPAADGNNTTASGGAALQANKPAGNNGSTGAAATYDIHFSQPGTYRLYIRDKFAINSGTTNDNSLYVPPDGNITGNANKTFDNNTNGADGRTDGDYAWVLSTTPTTYTVNAAGDTTFTIAQRENGIYVDRIILSTNQSLTAAQLDAMSNTPVTLGTPTVTGKATGLSVALQWSNVPVATSYDVKRGTTAGGPYTTVATGVTALNYTDTVPAAGSYFYVVTANGGAGTTPGTSAEAKVVSTGAGAIAAPNVTVAAGTSNIVVNWAAPFVNVVSPTDSIQQYDDGTGSSPGAETVDHMIDGAAQKYLNFGKLNTGAIVTPASGATTINAIRLFTANDATERDPTSYVLEGSNDGGSNWNPISSGPLNLPLTRNGTGATPIDPTTQANQLVTFSNTTAYTSYRIYFPTVRNETLANSMQIGEVQFLMQPGNGGATGYNVKRGTSPDGPFTTIASNVNAGSYTDTTAVAGTKYYYVVSALSGGPESPDSAAVEGNLTVAGTGDGWTAQYYENNTLSGSPAVSKIDSNIDGTGNDSIRPAGLPSTFNAANAAGPGNSWSARWEGMVTAQHDEYYTIYPSTDDGVRVIVDGVVQEDLFPVGRGNTEDALPVVDANGVPVKWTTGSKHDVVIEFEQGGGGYDYHVRWSSPSTPKAIIPQSQVQALVPTTAPASLKAAPGVGTVALTWNSIAASSYKVLRGDSAAGPFTTIASNLTTTSYSDNAVTDGHQYFYEVIGSVIQGDSPATAPIAATPGPQPPVQVTGVTTKASPSNVVVSWPTVPFATSYKVLRGPVGGPYAQIASGVTGTSFTDPNVTLGNIYAYEVVATNAQGDGPASAPVNGDLKNGVTVRYYNDQWWKSPQGNTTGYAQPSLTGVDAATIYPNDNVIYGTDASPIAGIRNDNWADVITGQINIDAATAADPIVFVNNTDDDGYVLIDGQLVASDPGGHGQRDAYLGGTAGTPTPVTLTPGLHDIVQFHSEGGGGAGHILKWITHYGTAQQSALTVIPAGLFITTSSTPAAATDLVANPAPGTGVFLNWTDNAKSELGYLIQRSTSPTFALGTVQTVGTTGLNDASQTGTTISFTDTSNSGLQATYYRVVAVNFDASSASSIVSVPAFATGSQPGAEAHYFNNQWWNAADQSTAAPTSTGVSPAGDVNTVVPTVDAHGVDPDVPITGIRAVNFSSVFTGQFTITQAGTYTFPTSSDDDAYLYVDGQLVSADPGPHGPRPAPIQNPITLSAGPHDYQYFQSQGGGGWDWHLLYNGPETGGADQLMVNLQTQSSNLVAPGTLTASNVSSGSVTLSWTDNNTSEIQYVIERSTDNFVNNDVIVTLGINGNTYTDTSVAPNTSYTYRVHAVNFDMVGPSATKAVTTSATGTGGSITGSQATAGSNIDLTAQGTIDWAHWGLNGTGLDHKAGATSHIGDLAGIGGGSKTQIGNSTTGFTWSDGAPTATASNTTTGVSVAGVGKGLEFTAPADATTHRLYVYVGVSNATGQLSAHLSDGSSVPFTSTTIDNAVGGVTNGVYVIDYKASAAGQSLIVDFTETADHGTGSISIEGAAVGNPTDLIAPSLLSVRQTGNNAQVRFSNNSLATATGLVLQRSTDPNFGAGTVTNINVPGNASVYFDSGPFTAGTQYYYRIQANGAGGPTAFSNSDSFTAVTVPNPLDYSGGFGSAFSDFTLNNGATITGDGRLELTDGNNGETRSAFYNVPVTVSGNFTSTFDFQLGGTTGADGFTFVLQSNGPTALGGGGGSLGIQGVPNSVAMQFNMYNGVTQTGLIVNGAAPSVNRQDMSSALGNAFHAGSPTSIFHVTLTYDATTKTLHETVVDTGSPNPGGTGTNTYTHDYSVDIPAILGTPTPNTFAWVGFTGATGGANSVQDVLNWKFQTTSVVVPPPNLLSTTIGDGTAQRSEVRSIKLTFDHAVTLGAGAVTLNLLNSGGSGLNDNSAPTDASAALGTPTSSDGGITWTIPIKTSTAFSDATGSLSDGIFTVTIHAANVTDASNNTLAGGDKSTTFHRLFGDINGSKNVNNTDFGNFRNAFNSTTGNAAYVNAFDSNNDGVINNADFGQFRNRFNKVFTY